MQMIKDIPKKLRPREKLLNKGASSLSNEELLAIILKTGTKDRSVFKLSTDIINKISNFSGLVECNINFLLEIKGIGIAKACEVVASVELGKRLYILREKNIKRITSSTDVYESVKDLLSYKKQEYFYCIYLNNKNEILERKLLFMGTVNKSVVHPREVFKYAYLYSASGIICAHNHPS